MTDIDRRNNLASAIQTGIDSALKEVHTCLPGVVVKFTPTTQLADIQISIKRTLGEEIVNLPLLIDVPVRFLKVFGFSITLPLKVDDEVLLIFAERSIDTWLEKGGIKNPLDIRRHSLSDAFAIPMMFNQEDLITSFDPDNLQIRTTAGKGITITPTGNVELNGSTDSAVAFTDLKTAFDTLKTELNAFITIFNAHVHSGVTGGAGSTAVSPTPGVTAIADMSAAEVTDVKVT